jgi:hypothetical protein
MRYAISCGALALLVSLTFMLGAARPFERVTLGDPAYSQLAALDGAGLLQGFSLPPGELSRLEVAVLLQKALGGYGEAQLGGQAPDSAAQEALSALLTSFADELGQLGVKSSGLPVISGDSNLVQRVSTIESEMASDAEEEDASNTYLASLYPQDEAAAEEEAAASGIESKPYGKFYIHANSSQTKLKAGGHDDLGDVKVYWGELGWDVSQKDWSARVSMLWDDAAEDIGVYEAWAKYKNPDSGWFVQLGQCLLPFSNNDYYFPTYPAVNDLGFATAHAIGTGVEREGWGISVYAYNPKVDIVGEEDSISDYSVVWNITEREATECQDGWKLRAGYNTHLGSDDLRIAGDGPHNERVAAYNAFGRYDWGGNRYHLLADYTAALDDFDEQDLDTDADHIGDSPSALNTELIYEPHPDNLWGVSYQMTDQMADYAENRYGFLYGRRLSELATLKLEYTHGEFGKYITQDQQSDNSVVAEVYFEF